MGVKAAVVGVGKLGACAAAAYAYRGFRTVCVDIDDRAVAAINSGRAPVVEPRLQDLIDRAGGRLTATDDYGAAVRDCDITFLVVPTPSMENNEFSDRFLRAALQPLAAALGESDKPYHLFVITSTVSPGNTQEALIPLIERASGKRLNVDFGVCYNPEFIALGSVVSDMLNPDLVMIGESDGRAGQMLEEFYAEFCENTPRVARMSLISAEITKIAVNSYVTMKISFANTLASLCEHIEGADIDAITRAMGADRRISPFYLKGGPAFGGPCFPRDNKAFVAFARRYGCEAPLTEATDRVNRERTHLLVETVLRHAGAKRRIAILGAAYKPRTPVIEESTALPLIEALLRRGCKVTVYDPLAMDNLRARFGDRLVYARSPRDCVADSQVCVVHTPAEEYLGLDESFFVHDAVTLIDCWRVLDPARFGRRASYLAIGRRGAAAGEGMRPVEDGEEDLPGISANVAE